MTREEAIKHLEPLYGYLLRGGPSLTRLDRNIILPCLKYAIDTLKNQSQLPANLDAAVEELEQFADRISMSIYKYGIIRGAKWMAEQGVSYEAELIWEMDGDRAFPELDPPVTDLMMPGEISLNFNDGDKVIVQIRKAE